MNEERVEEVARELCRAAGKHPDARIRLGEPVSFAAGECTIVKPLFVPGWKAYAREARRLAMADAEHAEAVEESGSAGTRPGGFGQIRRSLRILRVVMRRRSRRIKLATRLRELPTAFHRSLSAS
jgi:hypothetical protein